MNAILKFLFPLKPEGHNISLLLLAFRILFGILLMTHGVQKWMQFSQLSANFPDPLAVGSDISLGLAIFGEVICSIGFILGIGYRLAILPMIFTMGVAFFVIHEGDPFAVKELAFVYMIVYIIMFIIGPGRYALDRYLAVSIAKK